MTTQIKPCNYCGVPNDLHGTCCGWENASAPCNASMVITDARHPGFGKPLNLWKHTFYEGNEDGYDISEKSGYKSGWDAGVAYASERTKELEKALDELQMKYVDRGIHIRRLESDIINLQSALSSVEENKK